MILIHPELNKIFDTDTAKVNTIVIENRKLFYNYLTELNNQINGSNGKFIVSMNDKPVSISKYVEIFFDFISFDINKKTLLNKMVSSLEKIALDEEHYIVTMDIIGKLEMLMNDLVFQSGGDILFTKLTAGTVIKALFPQFNNDYDSLSEKILDYMELVSEYEGKKLFLTVNLRSYIDDEEMELFMKSVLMHGYDLIMVENHCYSYCNNENRLIIDEDLCTEINF